MSQQRKIDRLSSVPDQFTSRVAIAQTDIFSEILVLLDRLERDGESIAMNAKNLGLLSELEAAIQAIVNNSDYISAVKEFSSEMETQRKLNQEYYKELGYTETPAAAALIQQTKRSTMKMLVGSALDANFYTPVLETIENAIASGSGFGETVKNLRVVVEGGTNSAGATVEGKLSRYVKQIAKDAFSIFDSKYNQQVTADLGLEFYLYSGGTISDTREFCSARNGKYFHKKEVESWPTASGSYESNPSPRGSWDGMNRQTNSSNIFSFRGGHNCNHTLIPVPASGIPVSVLQRNLDNGNWQPNQKTKDVLGVN